VRSPNLSFELEKAWRLATAPLRPLPSFAIAGAPKCGTSTLYDYLATLPGVRRGARKEPTNFLHFPGSRLRAAMNYPIRLPGQDFIVGDGSVEYFTDPRGPRNVHDVVPDIRLIFILRDPVKRAWSDSRCSASLAVIPRISPRPSAMPCVGSTIRPCSIT